MNKLSYTLIAALASVTLASCGGDSGGSSAAESSSSAAEESSSVASSTSSVTESSSSVAESSSSEVESSSSAPAVDFEVTSPAFDAGDELGDAYTCEGKNFLDPDNSEISPAVDWTPGPEGTQSYAIVFKDVTIIQEGGFNVDLGYHWAMWNVPASVTSIPEAMTGGNGGIEGASQLSPYDDNKFLGPCPSYNFCQDNIRNVHEYTFTVYALDQASIQPGASVAAIDTWLAENALEMTEILVTSDAAANAACGGTTESSSSSVASSSSSSEAASSSSEPTSGLLFGEELYAQACAGCHAPDTGADKRGRPFETIKDFIENFGPMQQLSDLTDEQIQSIADL